ncbi:dual specificity protein phosphatase 23-like [Cylas formicarius]|uniref:dual specificity protein phosphatase 23-like n=1 Tax=Cylas formicarius TaxID=197179 RepID=UPI002958D9EC|nr:dual specificity protein phosphatase 23-like [Cylas formicarius]XP_060523882.1 dual specificity protein phosphatase 23-like [Cylas formicarius]
MGSSETGCSATPPINFSWIDENILAACGWPRTEENLDFLITMGIKHLVTLSSEFIPPLANVSGLEWTFIPIEEFEAPVLDDIRKFITICEKHRQKNEAVAVHCRSGRGRTGVMVACYLVHYFGIIPPSAICNVRMARSGSLETYAQEKAVSLYYDYLRVQK